MTIAAQKTPPSALTTQPTSSGNIAGYGAAAPIIYGIDRVEAIPLSATVDGENLILVCVWGVGPIDAILAVTINNRPAPASVTIRHYLGEIGQQPDPKLKSVVTGYGDSGVATVSGQQVAISYSVIEIPSGAVSGWPRITATIRGRKVFDPRTGNTEWSDNPALCLADLISSNIYGQGRPVSGVEEAANFCDEIIGGAHRRTVGITIRQRDSVISWVETLRTYAGCFVVNEGDFVRLVPDRQETEIIQVAESDYIAGSLRASYPDIREKPTAVRVEYTDTSSVPWRTGAAVAKAAGVDSGATVLREERISLPGIHNSAQAMREAQERLRAAQLGGVAVEWIALDSGLMNQQGDVVQIELFGQPLQLRVMTVEDEGAGRYRVTARGYDPSIYSNSTEGVELMPPPPPILEDNIAQPNITGTSSGGGVYVPGGDGTVFNRVRIDLEPPPDGNFDHYEIRFRVAGSNDPWASGIAVGSVAFLQPVEDGVEYDYQVRAIGKMGGASDWVAGAHSVQGKDTPPPPPASLDVVVTGAGVRKVSWLYPNEPRDLAGFRVQWDAGQGWIDLLDGLTMRRLVETNEMPAGNVNIRVRAEDRTGNASGWKYHSSNIAQGPDGVWYDVDQRIEAERVRNDHQDSDLTDHDGRIIIERDKNINQDGELTDHDGRIYTEKGRNDGQDGSLVDHDGRIVVERDRNNTQDGSLSNHDSRISTESQRNDGQDGTLDTHTTELNYQSWQIGEVDSKATAAQSDAVTAQQEAANALQVAGLKASVFYQSYAPGNASEGDLWINTGENYHPYVMKDGGWADATVLQANVVQATHINVSALSAISANLGTVTTGRLNFSTGGFLDLDAPSGIMLQNSSNTVAIAETGWMKASSFNASSSISVAGVFSASNTTEITVSRDMWFSLSAILHLDAPRVVVHNSWAGNNISLEQWILNLVRAWINAGYLDNEIGQAAQRYNSNSSGG